MASEVEVGVVSEVDNGRLVIDHSSVVNVEGIVISQLIDDLGMQCAGITLVTIST